MKDYRIKRPAKHDDLLNLLKDKENGVFGTLKSALVFAAVIGFKENQAEKFSEQGEPVALSIFNEETDVPIMYLIALSKTGDISHLREEKFEEVLRIFEEYAAGGLGYLDRVLDKTRLKHSIQEILYLSRTDSDDNILDGFITSSG